MKQEMKLVLQKDVINGFSYSFTEALLEKLQKLDLEDRIFAGGSKKALIDEQKNLQSEFTSVASSVIAYLKEQLEFKEISTTSDKPNNVTSLIEFGQEFLAIFQKEK